MIKLLILSTLFISAQESNISQCQEVRIDITDKDICLLDLEDALMDDLTGWRLYHLNDIDTIELPETPDCLKLPLLTMNDLVHSWWSLDMME